MAALREEEGMNHDLRAYIGRILDKIIENHPSLLEIQPSSNPASPRSGVGPFSWQDQ